MGEGDTGSFVSPVKWPSKSKRNNFHLHSIQDFNFLLKLIDGNIGHLCIFSR